MTSLVPIWVTDFASNVLLLALAGYMLAKVRRIVRLRPGTPLWMYLQWQVMALALFALSHSVGHILRRVLLLAGRGGLWEELSPYTGSVNTITFVVVAIVTFLYRDLESASEQYGTLKDAKRELEETVGKLRESSVKTVEDAREILRKNLELTALNRIAMAAGKSLEMETVMATVITEVKAFLAADYLGIYLLEGDRLRLRLSDGLPEALIGRASDWKMEEEPWLKRVVMEGKSFHAQERAGEKAGRIDEAFKREGVQAWAAVPLLAKGKVIGALTVGTFDYSGIDPGQMETLTTIGRYAGVVIENSLLYEELRLRVEDLERFRRFSVGREKRIIELKKKLGMGDNG